MLGPAMARRTAPVDLDLDLEQQPGFFGQLLIKVLRCEKSTDGGHINYVYEAALSNQKWLVKRRYSDFEKLHESLCRRFRKIKNQMPQLPKTAWYRKTDADYVKKKGIRLETYLNGLLAIADVANSPELYNFFFKARFAIGMRASFSGMPDPGSFANLSMAGSPPESGLGSTQSSPSIQSTKHHGLQGLSPCAFDEALMCGATWETDGAALMSSLPKGSADYQWLSDTNEAIAHKSAELDSLKFARDEKVRSLLTESTHTTPTRLFSSASPCTSPEQLGSATDAKPAPPLHNLLGQTQPVDCSIYGGAEAIQQAIQLGVLLVAFPEFGTEVAVQLQQATGDSLCGHTTLNGQLMRFEGSLTAPRMTSGTGCLLMAQ